MIYCIIYKFLCIIYLLQGKDELLIFGPIIQFAVRRVANWPVVIFDMTLSIDIFDITQPVIQCVAILRFWNLSKENLIKFGRNLGNGLENYSCIYWQFNKVDMHWRIFQVKQYLLTFAMIFAWTRKLSMKIFPGRRGKIPPKQKKIVVEKWSYFLRLCFFWSIFLKNMLK